MEPPADLTVLREIAETAHVHPDARVGPFCLVGPEASIGAGTVLGCRVTVIGRTTIGRDNLIGDGSVLGAAPQDLKFRGRPTYLILGDRNRVGPNVTAHVGTEAGGYLTRVGNDNLLAAGVHVAHDCYVDDHTRLEAGVLLAGHIRVEDGAVIEEKVGVHHFTTVGRFSRVISRTPIRRDVPPFTVFGSVGYYDTPATIRGVHEAGLAAAGLEEPQRQQLRQAVRQLFEDERALSVKVRAMLGQSDLPAAVRELCEFCRRSLEGHFGRYRETFRGKVPPEAARFLAPQVLAEAQRREGAGLR